MNERDQIIDKRILRTLRAVNGALHPQSALLDGVALNFEPRLLDAEFQARLRFLESRGLVLGLPDGYGEPKWKITDQGRAFCVEHGF